MNGKPLPMLEVKEAAELVGVHPNTIYTMVQEGTLKALKFGSKWKIPIEWLVAGIIKETAGESSVSENEVRELLTGRVDGFNILTWIMSKDEPGEEAKTRIVQFAKAMEFTMTEEQQDNIREWLRGPFYSKKHPKDNAFTEEDRARFLRGE